MYIVDFFLSRMSTCSELFKREIGIKSNLSTLIARNKLKECVKNECLFDTDQTFLLCFKLFDLSRNKYIAKLLIDIIEEDKTNDIGSIVFVARTLVRRGTCLISQAETDESQCYVETLLKDLF